MADETAKVTQKGKGRKVGRKPGVKNERGVTPKKLQVICLRKLGWTLAQTAQACNISIQTVHVWGKELEDYFADLPAPKIAWI